MNTKIDLRTIHLFLHKKCFNMLYYTGAIQPNAIQDSPSKSLGGYVSSSVVPNDVINNLFSDIYWYDLKHNLKHIRVIAFLNTTDETLDDFTVHVNSHEDNVSKLKIGIIKNEVDEECDVKYFETLPNATAVPQYVELKECEGAINSLMLSDIPPNNYVGIFIQRELIPEKNPETEGNEGNSCDVMFDKYNEDPTGEVEIHKDEFEIVIRYGEIETNLYVYAGGDREERLPIDELDLFGIVTSDYAIKNIEWSAIDAPNTPTLINKNQETLTLKDLVEGEYKFRLTGSDILNNEKYDEMTLNILPSRQVNVYFGTVDTRDILTEPEIIASDSIKIDRGTEYEIDFVYPENPKFYWFAEPITEPIKTFWRDKLLPLNGGNIGTDQDLFDEPIIVGVYRFYISVYKTQIENVVEFKK